MYNFNYHRPSSVADAAKTVQSAPEGKLVAGGMTLIPTLKQRLAKPSDLVDLAKIGELKGIKKDGNNVVIGAMTRHADVAKSDVVKSAIPALAALGATVVTTKRKLAAEQFFTGMFETALEPGEIVTAVQFPVPEKAAYMK